MKIKNMVAITLGAFAMIMTAMPLTAGGSKDTEEETLTIPENSVLHVAPERPFGFGEGGGTGAAQRPEGFEVIPDGIVADEASKTVTADLTSMTGVLKVKGGKGNRKFTFKSDDGKSYNLKVEEKNAEHMAKLKNKKIKVDGVFYGKEFLIFDFAVVE